MTLSLIEFKGYVESLQNKFVSEIGALEEQCDAFDDWLETVKDAAVKGTLASIGLLSKTPGKKRGALGTINESVDNTSQLDAPEEPVPPLKKPNSVKKKSNKHKTKRKQTLSSDEDETSGVGSDGSSKRPRTSVEEEVTKLHDSCNEMNNDTESTSQSQAHDSQRSARITRTTFVKETRETYVIEERETREFEKPSTLKPPAPPPSRSRSPSSSNQLASERQDTFKAPRLLKPGPVVPDRSSCSPPKLEMEVAAPPLRMTRTKTRAMAKAAQKEVTKETPKSPEEVPQSPTKSPVAEKHTENESDQDSETTVTSISSVIGRPGVSSFLKQKVGTPIGKTYYSAQIGTPNTSNVITGVHSFIQRPAPASVKKDRQEDYLLKITQKTNDASKKREEMIKAQTEEKIKKRQEKVLKVNAAREAIERERAEKLRQQIILEEERLEAKRRKLARQKAAEAAEAAKVAKRLQEEEQKRLAEEKRKELEEQKRLAEEKKREQELLRLAEERKREEEERRRLEEKRREEEKKRMAEKKRQLEEQRRLARAQEEAERRRKEQEEAEKRRKEQEEAEKRRKEQEEVERRKYEAEKAAALKAKAASAAAKNQLNETYVKPLDETYVKQSNETFVHPSSTSYNMTPVPQDRKPVPPKSKDDYGIDDADCDDSSDDESNPKKEVPLWALAKHRAPRLECQYYVRHRQVAAFFGSKKSTPDLSKIFRQIDRKMLIRKSSAVWRTPPVKFNESVM